MADTLRILLKGSTVLAPDVPIEPEKALAMLQGIVDNEKPDISIGLSLGGFWVQKLRGTRRLAVNPDFHISRLLRTMTGEVRYLSPRADGAEYFSVTPELCDKYEALEKRQFGPDDSRSPYEIRGMFADSDELVDCKAEFEGHYPGCAYAYPGTHLPNFPQCSAYILPAVLEMTSEKTQ